MDIKHYIENTSLTLQQIAGTCNCSINKVRTVWMTYSKEFRQVRKVNNYRLSKLGTANPMKGKTGTQHHNYKGVVADGKGYLLILKPEWYTGRKGSKHIFHHHYVACKALGLTAMPKGYVVHHCDEDKQNNSFDNLVLLTMSEHTALHQVLEGATTISKESTLKWVEARRSGKPDMI